jgi:hypothetical protein
MQRLCDLSWFFYFIGLGVTFTTMAHAQELSDAAVTITGRRAELRVSSTPRPLRDGLLGLSRAFHWRVGFEEACLRFSGDLVDMTSPNYVPKPPIDRAYDPRGGPLGIEFDILPENERPPDRDAVIRILLAEYHARGYPGQYAFSAEPGNGGYTYVYPDKVANTSGSIQRAITITGVHLKIVVKDKETVREVFRDAVSQMARLSGRQVVGPGVGNQPWPSRLARIDEPAYTFLDDAASAFGVRFWQVLWDPTMKYYAISFCCGQD